MFEQDKVLERKRSELRKQEESLARTKREAEKQAVKSKTVAQTHTGSGSSTEAQLQAELDKCMVSRYSSTTTARY